MDDSGHILGLSLLASAKVGLGVPVAGGASSRRVEETAWPGPAKSNVKFQWSTIEVEAEARVSDLLAC